MTDDREQMTDDREQMTDNRRQRTENRRQKTDDRRLIADKANDLNHLNDFRSQGALRGEQMKR